MEEHLTSGSSRSTQQKKASPQFLNQIDLGHGGELRVRTGSSEFDNVLGGGLVAGSVVLIGGDPGVGKSTLLLTVLGEFAKRGVSTLYVSGEESNRQTAIRAKRLGVADQPIQLLSTNEFSAVEASLKQSKPQVMVIDSIQTLRIAELESISGSISQVREIAQRAVQIAKSRSIAVLLVGHITKSGDLAGPKVLEHYVDAVLHFEGDGRSQLRILRSVKNRFGAAGELGLFEMVDSGLREVPDASARLLQERAVGAAGTAVTASLEGTRPILIEVQALVGNSGPQIPARNCVGVDRGRVSMLAAVLEKAGICLSDRDIFVNAAGGVRISEPAVDLAIVGALVSSLLEKPLDQHTLLLGEVGLVGEVRNVSHPKIRLKEAARHGFTRIVGPKGCKPTQTSPLEIIEVGTVQEAIEVLF